MSEPGPWRSKRSRVPIGCPSRVSPVTDIGAHQASRVPRVWPPIRWAIRRPSPVFEGGEHIVYSREASIESASALSHSKPPVASTTPSFAWKTSPDSSSTPVTRPPSVSSRWPRAPVTRAAPSRTRLARSMDTRAWPLATSPSAWRWLRSSQGNLVKAPQFSYSCIVNGARPSVRTCAGERAEGLLAVEQLGLHRAAALHGAGQVLAVVREVVEENEPDAAFLFHEAEHLVPVVQGGVQELLPSATAGHGPDVLGGRFLRIGDAGFPGVVVVGDPEHAAGDGRGAAQQGALFQDDDGLAGTGGGGSRGEGTGAGADDDDVVAVRCGSTDEFHGCCLSRKEECGPAAAAGAGFRWDGGSGGEAAGGDRQTAV